MARAETIALVLAGGGARGAYEIGALSVLLGELDRRGQRPSLVIGTSVGALNAAFLGATAHRPVDEVVTEGLGIWGEIRYRDVLSPLLGLREARRIGAYLGEVLGLPVDATSLLDPAPLPATLARTIAFDDLRRNAVAGRGQTAVVATSAATSRTVVFHTTGPSPGPDETRGIDYVRADLGVEHVMASAAIPVVFPAVDVTTPKRSAGWYFDGGTRLNAPIKPALSLGADRVVVIGVNSVAARRATGDARRPDIADGAGQLLQAVLVDPLVNDVNSLASGNREAGRRTVPYVFVAPPTPEAVGRLAADTFNEHYRGVRGLARSRDVTLLGRAISGGRDADHGELLSYLFFAPEFTRALADLGRADAERWLSERHDDGLWQVTTPLS
jgi:NTE family protein